ncbi:MAG TPA: hypothetical protein VNI52_06570 [Sphingobacteriaceae bacterium]|nr:hypothetical protein [Sphingobacteriaceae bacterium]
MTFEEFFSKKKIDLDQLKNAEPVLFEEFRFDYSLMGNKSFDHTKKYWFNKLRRLYHLKQEPKPEFQRPELNALATQAEPLSSLTIDEKPGYTPRFKPGMETKPKTDNAGEKEISVTPKPAYKPRFNAGAIKKDPVQNESNFIAYEEKTTDATINPDPLSKPAYKPRFKPAMLKQKPNDDEAGNHK